ncbi:MAG: hypothetical protein LBJ89_02265, partial [Holosporales bacterium]|nr:hypothetical protein [Holosporales bacterium]
PGACPATPRLKARARRRETEGRKERPWTTRNSPHAATAPARREHPVLPATKCREDRKAYPARAPR